MHIHSVCGHSFINYIDAIGNFLDYDSFEFVYWFKHLVKVIRVNKVLLFSLRVVRWFITGPDNTSPHQRRDAADALFARVLYVFL